MRDRIIGMALGALIFVAGYAMGRSSIHAKQTTEQPDSICADCVRIDEYPIRGRT